MSLDVGDLILWKSKSSSSSGSTPLHLHFVTRKWQNYLDRGKEMVGLHPYPMGPLSDWSVSVEDIEWEKVQGSNNPRIYVGDRIYFTTFHTALIPGYMVQARIVLVRGAGVVTAITQNGKRIHVQYDSDGLIHDLYNYPRPIPSTAVNIDESLEVFENFPTRNPRIPNNYIPSSYWRVAEKNVMAALGHNLTPLPINIISSFQKRKRTRRRRRRKSRKRYFI